jgi:hypothetical protein
VIDGVAYTHDLIIVYKQGLCILQPLTENQTNTSVSTLCLFTFVLESDNVISSKHCSSYEQLEMEQETTKVNYMTDRFAWTD